LVAREPTEYEHPPAARVIGRGLAGAGLGEGAEGSLDLPRGTGAQGKGPDLVIGLTLAVPESTEEDQPLPGHVVDQGGCLAGGGVGGYPDSIRCGVRSGGQPR